MQFTNFNSLKLAIMKIKINSLYIVTSRNEEPAMYDNLQEALQDGVERQQDPSDKPLEIGDLRVTN